MKRMEKRRFGRLWRRDDAIEVQLTTSELALFLEGSELVGRRELSPPPLQDKDLALFARS